MEPYVIICKSCTARLKVSNEALIGQRLGCPKCQAMIDIVPPEGYQPPATTGDSEMNTGSDTAISNNFEDIDSLLASSQQDKENQQPKRKSKSGKNSKRKPAGKLKPIQPTSARTTNSRTPRPRKAAIASPGESNSAVQQQSQQPLLTPNSQWDSEAARKKKRVLQIITFALLATLAIGAGVWAILSSGSTDKLDKTIAKNDPATIESPNQESPSNPVNTGDAADGTNVTENDPSPPTGEKSPVSPSQLPPTTVVNNSARQSLPPPLEVNTPSNSTIPTNGNPKNLTDQNDSPNNATTPLAAEVTHETSDGDDTSPLIPSTKNSLGELSKILQGQGTSLKEIEDIAEIQKERALIGTPTYLIERPDRKELNIERQLAGELSGWKLDNVPLIDAVNDLEMLSDVPVTFDPKIFHDGSFDILRPITLKVEAISFQSAFEKLLADDGLMTQPTTMGVDDYPPLKQ